jgi:hypothetical protein
MPQGQVFFQVLKPSEINFTVVVNSERKVSFLFQGKEKVVLGLAPIKIGLVVIQILLNYNKV